MHHLSSGHFSFFLVGILESPKIYIHIFSLCRVSSLGRQKHQGTGYTGCQRNMWMQSKTPSLANGNSFDVTALPSGLLTCPRVAMAIVCFSSALAGSWTRTEGVLWSWMWLLLSCFGGKTSFFFFFFFDLLMQKFTQNGALQIWKLFPPHYRFSFPCLSTDIQFVTQFCFSAW